LDPQRKPSPYLHSWRRPPGGVIALIVFIERENNDAVKIGLDAVDRFGDIAACQDDPTAGRERLITDADLVCRIRVEALPRHEFAVVRLKKDDIRRHLK